MKNLFILFLLALAIFELSGCADTGITSSSTSGEAVAGEKTPGAEERVGAGMNGMAPSAQVKW